MGGRLVFVVLLASIPLTAATQRPECTERDLADAATTGRDYVAGGVDARGARAAWNEVLDCGGAIAWPATLYSVDARATFVFTFDRTAVRIYRSESAQPEAVIPWSDVREVEAGNWVIWFRMRTPVEIASDRRVRTRVKELKVFLHGGDGGELTYYSNVAYAGRHWFWGTPVYEVTNLRGIAVGPTEYQRRVAGFLVTTFDTDRHIRLKEKGRGAGW
jgi:hypothetical protein